MNFPVSDLSPFVSEIAKGSQDLSCSTSVAVSTTKTAGEMLKLESLKDFLQAINEGEIQI